MPSQPFARALVFCTLLAVQPAVAQSDSPRLFGTTVGAASDAAPANAAIVRERLVRPDLTTVDAIARRHVAARSRERFILDLFPGLDLDAEVIDAEIRTSGTTLFAKLADVELGTAILTHEQGHFVATINFPGGSYVVERVAGGDYRVAQTAPHLLPPEAPPRARFAQSPAADFAQPDVPLDSGRLIDVMILWTGPVQTAAGGAAALQALAQASIDSANLTYLNSGVAQRLRLVHAQQVTYTEHTGCGTPQNPVPSRFDCALDDLTDGAIAGVHALRDQHGADLVSLFIADSTYCGLAWLPVPSAATSGLGYSVLHWNGCPVANMSFVHELGHNMGAHHDPFVAPGPGAYAYSHGKVDVVNRWRTVLAYNNECGAQSCTRVQYLSNPKLTYNGAAMGDAAARNNAHTLNKTAKAIAAYRPTSALHPVPQRFADVATTHVFHGHIEFFAQAGLSSGCAAGMFCPDASTTRRQMAVFLERAMRAANWVPPAATGLFSDVPAGAQFRDHVEALRNDNITMGCTPTTYCPDAPVTRAQMAAFLLRARCGATYQPNAPATASFADVATNYPFFPHIEKLYALGVTGGCATGPLRYCPDAPVTRAQMAVFVERLYPLLTPSEACAP